MTEGPALFEGRIDYIEQLGEVQLVYIDLGQGAEPLTAKLGGNVALKRGAVLRIPAGDEARALAAAEAAAEIASQNQAWSANSAPTLGIPCSITE